MSETAALQALLQERAKASTKDWWERYLRHRIEFRGVATPDIRASLTAWRHAQSIDQLDQGRQLDLA